MVMTVVGMSGGDDESGGEDESGGGEGGVEDEWW